MTNLEQRLCKSSRAAFVRYLFLTDQWLSHAPEHFIQNFIFMDIGEDEYIYAEATRKKIMDGEGRPRRGRPPADRGKRHDLVSWNRSTDTLHAVIEIKRCYSMNDYLRKDARRIKSSLSSKHAPRAAYLLVFAEAKNDGRGKSLDQKFGDWADELSLKFLNKKDYHLADFDKWSCGFALFRA